MLLASTYFMLFAVKACCQDWGEVYLTEERGVDSQIAASFLTSMEIGGMFGCVLLGALTDLLIRHGFYEDVNSSPRMIVVQFCVAGAATFMNLFIFIMDEWTTRVIFL